MTLKGGIVVSVHTTVIFQAFNGLEHGIAGARFFCTHSQEGRGLLCPGPKGRVSIRGEDTYVRLRL